MFCVVPVTNVTRRAAHGMRQYRRPRIEPGQAQRYGGITLLNALIGMGQWHPNWQVAILYGGSCHVLCGSEDSAIYRPQLMSAMGASGSTWFCIDMAETISAAVRPSAIKFHRVQVFPKVSSAIIAAVMPKPKNPQGLFVRRRMSSPHMRAQTVRTSPLG
jgi:hypothetical protein